MSIRPELKPCPFCGGKARHKTAKYQTYSYGVWTVKEWHAIYCPPCHVGQKNRNYETFQECIEAWNRRADERNGGAEYGDA